MCKSLNVFQTLYTFLYNSSHPTKDYYELITETEDALTKDLQLVLNIKRRELPLTPKELEGIKSTYESVKTAREEFFQKLHHNHGNKLAAERAAKLYVTRCQGFHLIVKLAANDTYGRKIFFSWDHHKGHHDNEASDDKTISDFLAENE